MPSKTFTEAERQARREADRERAKEAVEALRTSDGWQGWLRSRRHFAEYSLSNQCLIAYQLATATKVCGFRTWLKLGYCPQKGSRALRIWMPIPPSKAAIEAWEAAGADPADRPRLRWRQGPVFDRSQVVELPPPSVPVPLDPPITAPQGDSLAWAFPRLAKLVGDLRCALVIERHPDGRGGCFIPELRIVSLNEAKSVNHQVKTLVHELAHVLLRWNTELGELQLTYSQEEVVVESVAFTVCGSALGLDTSGYSIPYIASWSEDEHSLAIVDLCAGWIDKLAKQIEDAIGDPPATTTNAQMIAA